MLKIGVIGLGKIARKAYLPILGSRNLEVHLCTRNAVVQEEIARQYRFPFSHPDLSSLINAGIDAAFIHSSTHSHEEIVEKLIEKGIHVFVDKPLTYHLESSERLVRQALARNVLLQVGFNRRFAPAYRNLQEVPDPNLIIMQKNRKSLPGDIRTFVLDDFIHVVDTLLFLLVDKVEKVLVSGRREGNFLYHVVIQLSTSTGKTALGIMNRDAGVVEERLEIFSASEKRVVTQLTDTVIYNSTGELRIPTNDWISTLYKRGFEDMVDHFLHVIESGTVPSSQKESILPTHTLCEEIVKRLEEVTH